MVAGWAGQRARRDCDEPSVLQGRKWGRGSGIGARGTGGLKGAVKECAGAGVDGGGGMGQGKTT